MKKSALALVLALALLASAAPAADSAAPAFEIDLGPVPQYRAEAEAIAACQPDGVVWADRKSGFYYPKFLAEYGKTANGSFTCFMQAKTADYWSTTASSDGGHKGREFPLSFFCNACS